MVTRNHMRYTLADRCNNARTLVAEDDRVGTGIPHGCKIGVADATGAQCHHHLARTRVLYLNLLKDGLGIPLGQDDGWGDLQLRQVAEDLGIGPLLRTHELTPDNTAAIQHESFRHSDRAVFQVGSL